MYVLLVLVGLAALWMFPPGVLFTAVALLLAAALDVSRRRRQARGR